MFKGHQNGEWFAMMNWQDSATISLGGRLAQDPLAVGQRIRAFTLAISQRLALPVFYWPAFRLTLLQGQCI